MFLKKFVALVIMALLMTQISVYADIKLTGKEKPFAILETRDDLEKINQALRDAEDRYFDLWIVRIDKPMAFFIAGFFLGSKL